jgi:tripartite ATP-independent transporter DctM subunit
MAATYALYIIIRCILQPSLAPAYDLPHIPLSEKIKDVVLYVLPLGSIVFLVTGLIFVGVATPSESAAVGTLGSFLLAACYRKLTWKIVKVSLMSALKLTVLMFMLVAAAKVFSGVVAFSGASRGLVDFAIGLPVPPLMLVACMLVVPIILGMFVNAASALMLALPLLLPVVLELGFDPVWFGVMFLLTLEMGASSPPFGLALFIMKGVAPNVTLEDTYWAALPFLACDVVVIILLLSFPSLSLWLPSLMH